MVTEFQGKKGSIYLRDFPRHIRNDFAAAVAKRGLCMKPVILEFMVLYAKLGNTIGALELATKKTLKRNKLIKIRKKKWIKDTKKENKRHDPD